MDKDLAGIGDRPSSPQVGQKGIANGRNQRNDRLEAGLGMPNHESVSTPVHIVQSQLDYLPGPQAVGGKQHEDRVVAQSLGRVVLAGRSKNGVLSLALFDRGHFTLFCDDGRAFIRIA